MPLSPKNTREPCCPQHAPPSNKSYRTSKKVNLLSHLSTKSTTSNKSYVSIHALYARRFGWIEKPTCALYPYTRNY